MKLNRITRALRSYFRLPINIVNFVGNVFIPPAGQQGVDNTALSGTLGGLQNVNEALDMDLICILGGTSTAITVPAATFINNIIDYTGSPGGGVTMTTPTAAQIIGALPNTIPGSGYNYLQYWINDSAGQTFTITAGSGVSVVGTMTVATATVRQVLVNVNPNAGTVTIVNMGGWNL